MRMTIVKILALLAFPSFVGVCASATAHAAAEPRATYGVAVSDNEDRYARQLEELRAEITRSLPKLAPAKLDAYSRAHVGERAAKAELDAAQARMGELGTAEALVGHAKGKWIGGADKGIAQARAQLETATTEAEREAAKAELVKWEENRVAGVQALEERQQALEKAKQERPAIEKAHSEAEQALIAAKRGTRAALENLGVSELLSSDTLDGRLAKYVVLLEATPGGLASFADQGSKQLERVNAMLADEALLVQMAVADGAKDAQYGRAMEIYSTIQEASSQAREGALQRFALAIALEHAVPRPQRNAVAQTDAPTHVDPIHRYLHFERAFLAGELDAGFETHSVWDYRMVVDGEEPDEILAWGREMLRNYRPDHITTKDDRWRYVAAVRSDVRYGSQDNKFDREDLQFFQNILMNGGVCGRRAFFGRFILRAFGVPTTARPQRGHAALTHWTPGGWVVCLGAGWGHGWTKTRYGKDLDFLANTQARATGASFLQVKRAQWIGDVLGEPRVFGFLSGEPEFWNGVALSTQRALVEDAKAKTLDAVGQDIAEANETKEKVDIARAVMTAADREIVVDASGVITIPASATSQPSKSTGKILFMNSHLGGKQLHYSRTGGHQSFEYTFELPSAGRYALTARIVTPSWKQSLLLDVNGAPEPIEIELPFTVGMWDTTEPVEVPLSEGRNVLRFRRDGEVKGVTIKDFTLTPIRVRAREETVED